MSQTESSLERIIEAYEGSQPEFAALCYVFGIFLLLAMYAPQVFFPEAQAVLEWYEATKEAHLSSELSSIVTFNEHVTAAISIGLGVDGTRRYIWNNFPGLRLRLLGQKSQKQQ